MHRIKELSDSNDATNSRASIGILLDIFDPAKDLHAIMHEPARMKKYVLTFHSSDIIIVPSLSNTQSSVYQAAVALEGLINKNYGILTDDDKRRLAGFATDFDFFTFPNIYHAVHTHRGVFAPVAEEKQRLVF